MKKTIAYILLAAILVLQLSGCGAGNGEEKPEDSECVSNSSADLGLNEQDNAENIGQDNSLDAYSAVLNAPLRVENPAGFVTGGNRVFLAASRGYYFMKHLHTQRPAECWDEVSYVAADGRMGSESVDHEHQIWDAGPIAGTDRYIVFTCEEKENEEGFRFLLTEKDENQEPVKEFPLNFLDGWDYDKAITAISNFAMDRFGVIHMVQHMGEGRMKYFLVSSEGEILTECDPDGSFRGLVPLYDGRVAFLVTKWSDEIQDIRPSLQCVDVETGKITVLAAPELDILYFTLLDNKTLLYTDQEGVYRSDLSGKNPELLYSWKNHGIAFEDVSAMQGDGKGQISLIYKDSQGYNYLCLAPTTEEVEIRQITMAVSPGRMSSYLPMAVEFNKQYPSWHIELKSDYEESALLTELIAGKGPVLIDTFLTGFEEQEKLWEPLDKILEESDNQDELLTSVLDMGKINGTQYGIVTDFTLSMLVTGDPNLRNWDYDTFLQCIQDRPELEAIFNFYGGDFRSYFILSYFSHGIDDTYLFDAETGTTNFDSSDFRKILELADRYCNREEGVDPGSSLLEGKVLCNELTIRKPEELAAYRICYGEDANYIGYPTKDGAVCFMESHGSPLAIRRSAEEEEKAAAAAFINLCLSYEGQVQAAKDLNFGLSIRRDVLEEQITAMNGDTVAYISGFGETRLGSKLDIDLDREILLDMIEKAKPKKYFPKELRDVIFEELDGYFSGTITEDMLIDNLESRVGLYLGERN